MFNKANFTLLPVHSPETEGNVLHSLLVKFFDLDSGNKIHWTYSIRQGSKIYLQCDPPTNSPAINPPKTIHNAVAEYTIQCGIFRYKVQLSERSRVFMASKNDHFAFWEYDQNLQSISSFYYSKNQSPDTLCIDFKEAFISLSSGLRSGRYLTTVLQTDTDNLPFIRGDESSTMFNIIGMSNRLLSVYDSMLEFLPQEIKVFFPSRENIKRSIRYRFSLFAFKTQNKSLPKDFMLSVTEKGSNTFRVPVGDYLCEKNQEQFKLFQKEKSWFSTKSINYIIKNEEKEIIDHILRGDLLSNDRYKLFFNIEA